MIKNHELIPLFSLIAILITVVTHNCNRMELLPDGKLPDKLIPISLPFS
jgi:hypothetical protein